MNKHSAYRFLEKLAFERVSGSEKELEAAHLLVDECRSLGVDAVIEPFSIPAPSVTDVRLEITSPVHQEIYCTGVGRTGQKKVLKHHLYISMVVKMNTSLM